MGEVGLINYVCVCLKYGKLPGVLSLLALSLAACAVRWPLVSAAPTPSPAVVINFEVTVVSLATATPTPAPTSTSTPTAAPSATATATSALLTLTPTPTATSTPPPTLTATPLSLLATGSPGETSTPAPAAAVTPVAISPVRGIITLLAPDSNVSIPSNIDQLEFKWRWQGDLNVQRCQPVPGYGFEVRIWPARDGFGPLGAMDAAKNQEDGNFACNGETGTYTYLVTYLKSKPGVKAMGAGKFLWDVAFVQLKPYQPVLTTLPRLFEINFDYKGSLDPFGAPLKCTDFKSWAEAQAVFLAAGGPAKDPHKLDPDGNGVACDELKK